MKVTSGSSTLLKAWRNEKLIVGNNPFKKSLAASISSEVFEGFWDTSSKAEAEVGANAAITADC